MTVTHAVPTFYNIEMKINLTIRLPMDMLYQYINLAKSKTIFPFL